MSPDTGHCLFLLGEGQFSKLRSEEYILDVTAELVRTRRDYDLVFQRTVWYFPFRTSDNLLYNELMYFQVSELVW